MEPITLAIVGALANLSQVVIKDAYTGIKGLISKKYGAESNVAKALDGLERDPKSDWRPGQLNEELVAVKAHQDLELKHLLDELQEKLKAMQPGSTNVTINSSGHHSIVSGTGNISVNQK